MLQMTVFGPDCASACPLARDTKASKHLCLVQVQGMKCEASTGASQRLSLVRRCGHVLAMFCPPWYVQDGGQSALSMPQIWTHF